MQYQQMPATFQDDGDESVLPERYDTAIVWRALRHYGLFEAAPEVVARADMAYKETMQQLWMDQAPEVLVGDPLC